MPAPKLLAMLIKQGIEGDDALLRLAQVRFQEAGLGAELYPASPEELQLLLAFRPADRPCTVHLPREINLLWPEARDRVMEFAVRAAGWVEGMTVHDHAQFGERPDAAIAALREADRRLAEVRNALGSSSNMPPAWRRMASPRYLKGRAIWNASRRALTSHTSGFRSAGRPTRGPSPAWTSAR